MDDDLERLRQEIFRVHGTPVGKDDPILMVHTLVKTLLAEGHRAQDAQLEQFKSELEGIAFQWGNEAKDKAERILNASLAASKEAMANLMQTSVKEASQAMRSEFEKALNKAEAPVKVAKGLMVLNVCVSLVTLASALLIAWSAFK